MAHRKLQQEIDRVFKKINEGLEIFNTYHERHENAINTSQKDKLENDLKREIKKLQKLREQIKVWQTSNDVKDKEKLLEYRRLVEVAMEKYKVIEKGSKVKAYSNMSLKAAAELDPEEQEKVDTINFIQESIDDLERQYQSVEVELEKLLSKKSKKNAVANEAKKEELKEIQSKYRWHQQNLELALRLLENDELVVADILEIKEDLEYFLANNRNEDFIDNEYIYESLDLDANEILQHEVVTSFNGLNEIKDNSPEPESQASPAPKSVTKTTATSTERGTTITTTTTTTIPNTTTTTTTPAGSLNSSVSPAKASPSSSIPTPKKDSVISSSFSTPSKPFKKFTTLNTTTASNIASPITSRPGTPSSVIGGIHSNTLKPAITPVKPVSEIKWSSLAASGLNNGQENLHEIVKNSPLMTNSTISVSDNNTEFKNVIQPSINSKVDSTTQSLGNLQISKDFNNSGTSDNKKEESPIILSNLDDSTYLNDEELINLPPGIQDIILSFYSNRVSRSNKIKTKINNISDYLTIPRYYLEEGQISQQFSNVGNDFNQRGLSNEFQRCFNGWNKVRLLFNTEDRESFQKILHELDIGTLFYGFYFSLSPFESKQIELEILRRNWKNDKLKQNWFQRLNNQPIIIDGANSQGFEVSNFHKFDSINWSLVELNSYKLDYSILS